MGRTVCVGLNPMTECNDDGRGGRERPFQGRRFDGLPLPRPLAWASRNGLSGRRPAGDASGNEPTVSTWADRAAPLGPKSVGGHCRPGPLVRPEGPVPPAQANGRGTKGEALGVRGASGPPLKGSFTITTTAARRIEHAAPPKPKKPGRKKQRGEA
jgi:hypothetical protein